MKADDAIDVRPCPDCYLCGTPGRELYTGLLDMVFAIPGSWTLKQCPNTACNLVWLDPVPLEEEILKAYRNYYTHGSNGPSDLFYQVGHQIYSLVDDPIARLTGIRESRNQLSIMHLSNEVAPGRLLEIGCGSGEFLMRMQALGWEVQGVDFDALAVTHCKQLGLDVECGDLQSVRYPSNHFDAITMNHVIEHLFDPRETLKECRRVLKPGGRLVVVTPNPLSRGHRQFGASWRGLEPPRHIHLFSPDNLRKLADDAGLSNVETYSTAAHAEIIWNGSLVIQEMTRNRNDQKRKNIPIGVFSRVRRFASALVAQYREHHALDRHPAEGEESVLVAHKMKDSGSVDTP